MVNTKEQSFSRIELIKEAFTSVCLKAIDYAKLLGEKVGILTPRAHRGIALMTAVSLTLVTIGYVTVETVQADTKGNTVVTSPEAQSALSIDERLENVYPLVGEIEQVGVEEYSLNYQTVISATDSLTETDISVSVNGVSVPVVMFSSVNDQTGNVAYSYSIDNMQAPDGSTVEIVYPAKLTMDQTIPQYWKIISSIDSAPTIPGEPISGYTTLELKAHSSKTLLLPIITK